MTRPPRLLPPAARAVAFAALLTLLTPLRAAAADDPWWAADKGLHFAASASLAWAGWGLGAELCDERWCTIAVSGGLALTAGVAKEAADAAGFGHPSLRDLAWDVLGTATGLAIVLLADQLRRPRPAPGNAKPGGTGRIDGGGPIPAPGPSGLSLFWSF